MKVFFAISILVAGALSMRSLAASGNAQAGQAVFNKTCKVCHGPQGQGNPAVAKALKVEMPDLGSKAVQAKSDAELAKGVSEGKGKMKPVKTISGTDVQDAIAFLRTLAK